MLSELFPADFKENCGKIGFDRLIFDHQSRSVRKCTNIPAVVENGRLFGTKISGASFRDGLLSYELEKSQKSNFEMSLSQVPGEEESHEAQLTVVRTEESEKLNS